MLGGSHSQVQGSVTTVVAGRSDVVMSELSSRCLQHGHDVAMCTKMVVLLQAT